MQTFDTPDELSEAQQERWQRGAHTIGRLIGDEVLSEAVMQACDEDGEWWELQVRFDASAGASVGGPRQINVEEPPADCWRLELILEAPVEFGIFIQLALRFPDATLFLPELALSEGDCRPIQAHADLDLVTIFEI